MEGPKGPLTHRKEKYAKYAYTFEYNAISSYLNYVNGKYQTARFTNQSEL